MDNIWASPTRRSGWSQPTFNIGQTMGDMLSSFQAPTRGEDFGGVPAFSRNTFDMSFGGGDRLRSDFDSPFLGRTTQSATINALDYASRMANVWGQVGGALPGMATGAANAAIGQVGSTGGAIDQANPYIMSAAQRFGVPAGLLKTIINNESSGDWAGNGNRYVTSIRPGSGGILPFVGIFENAWQSWGCPGTAAGAVGNEQAQVDCLAQGLKKFHDDPNNPNGWNGVITMHFAGEWSPSGWSDENGLSDYTYLNNALANWKNYDSSGMSQATSGVGAGIGSALGGALGATGGGGGINSVTGGQAFPITQEFGPTDFSLADPYGYYGYAADYGVTGHPGLDVGTPRGTQLYSPVSGTVSIAGGQPYYTFYGNGAPGVGELMITLDNGDQLILGHMEQINAQVGQRVNAGSPVGLSGGENGDHVHIEYRQKGGNTSSGFTAIDPRKALGGGGAASLGGVTGTAASAANGLAQTASGGGVMDPYAGWGSRANTYGQNPYAGWGRQF